MKIKKAAATATKNGAPLTLSVALSDKIRERAAKEKVPADEMAVWLARLGTKIQDGEELALLSGESLLNERSGEHLKGAREVSVIQQTKHVDVSLLVPLFTGAVFPIGGTYHLGSAEARDEDDVKMRCRQWKCMNAPGAARNTPPIQEFRAAMIEQGPSVPVFFRFSARAWKYIEEVARRLDIGVSDYLLGHVGYQVLFLEKVRPETGVLALKLAQPSEVVGISSPVWAPSDQVPFTLHLPDSVQREMHAYWSAPGHWQTHDTRQMIAHSIKLNLSNSTHLFNRPSARGIASPKGRLARIRQLLAREAVVRFDLTMMGNVWRAITERASAWSITPEEYVLVAADYHAALYRREQKNLEPLTPGDRFERALAREHRAR